MRVYKSSPIRESVTYAREVISTGYWTISNLPATRSNLTNDGNLKSSGSKGSLGETIKVTGEGTSGSHSAIINCQSKPSRINSRRISPWKFVSGDLASCY